MDKVAVLIPCYNESKTIAKVVADFKAVLPEGSVIYVYDNNSTDGTAEIALAAGAVVHHEYPAEFAPEMIAKVLDRGVDMVVGDRLSATYFTENKRPFHNFGNKLVRHSINALFKSNIQDIMTGYRAFSYQFVKSFPVLSKGFEIETEMSIHAIEKNMLVESVIVTYRDRPEGSVSKLNTVSDGIKVLGTIGKLYKNNKPFGFFGIIALVLAVIAGLLFFPVLSEYLHTGLVRRFPTLIVSGFIAIGAIQCFFSGLILETLHEKDRHDFEMELLSIRDRYCHKLEENK